MTRTVAIAVAMVASACGTEGGVLELELHLPPASAACGADRAAVRVVFERDVAGAGACPFDRDWAAGDCLADIPLGLAPVTERVSIVAGEDDLAEPLCVRVTFGEGGCVLGATPVGDARFRIGRAFADARYTGLTVEVADPCSTVDFDTLHAMVIP